MTVGICALCRKNLCRVQQQAILFAALFSGSFIAQSVGRRTTSPRNPTMTENEETLLTASPSMFRNHPIWFVLCCVLCLVAVGIPMLLVWYLEVKATRLTITNLRTTLHKGLLSRSITEVWHKDVRNVQLEQTFLQRVLGVGRIAVSSAGQSGIEIDVSGLSDPDEVKSLIDRHRTDD